MNVELIKANIEQVARIDGLDGDRDVRLDASEVAFLSQELEHMKSRLYEKRFLEMKSRRFIPVSTDVDPGAEAIAYDIFEEFGGKAELLANAGDDIELVEVAREKQTRPVFTFAKAYGWSIVDVWRAIRTRRRLQDRKAMACRNAHERRIDEIGAIGVSGTSVTGLVNDSGITITSPTTGDWVASATAAQIETDVNKLVNAVYDSTEGELPPNTVLMPAKEYGHIATTRIAPESPTTILEVLLNSNPWISSIEAWPRLKTAGAGSVTRMVCYRRDPEVLEFEIPLDFFQLPPQPKNISFVVPCLSRVSGVRIHHPKALGYMDGI